MTKAHWRADLTVVEGSESALSVADGKLSIKGTSVRASCPQLYADFGNYKIDVEATLQNPSDTSRWMSIMFRVTPDGQYFPYYQMAIRSNATAAQRRRVCQAYPRERLGRCLHERL